MKKYLPIVFCFFLASCQQNKPAEVKVQVPDSSNSLIKQLPGVYFGILPCPDCPGIEYTLTLNPDSTFYLKSVYYEKPADENTFVDAGEWTVEPGRKIILETSQDDYFLKVNEKTLLWLDKDGNEIKGTKANYQLTRMGKFEN